MSKAFVEGLHPPEFKVKVESKLDMIGHRKDKPDEVFDLVREVAIEWRTVELVDKQRHQTKRVLVVLVRRHHGGSRPRRNLPENRPAGRSMRPPPR